MHVHFHCASQVLPLPRVDDVNLAAELRVERSCHFFAEEEKLCTWNLV